MWDLFKAFSLAGRIGIVGAVVGWAIGMAAVFAVDWRVGLVVTVLSAGFTVFALRLFFGSEVTRRRLQREGIPAEATVLAVGETGMTVQGNYPLAKFRFEVHPPDGAPYETTAKCLVNRFEIPAYQPGTTVAVLIDPRDRSRVTLA
jgi:hypothetical protein